MSDAITPAQFHQADGVADWRVVRDAAMAHFPTGSFATGLALVDAIGRLAEAADHHPDLDLRYSSLTVRLTSHDIGGLSERDVALARQVSVAARELALNADPTAVQSVDLAIDALVSADVLPFWRALLGYRDDGPEDLVDPRGRGPSIWFQQEDSPRPERGRLHVDVSVPHDQAQVRIAAAVAAGGRLRSDEHAPAWWVLADAEGNEACIATWQGRG